MMMMIIIIIIITIIIIIIIISTENKLMWSVFTVWPKFNLKVPYFLSRSFLVGWLLLYLKGLPAYERTLRAALAAVREIEGELATTSLSNSPVAPCRLSCQISANQGEAETSANVNKHWKTRESTRHG